MGYNVKLFVVGTSEKLLNVGGVVLNPTYGDNPVNRVLNSHGEDEIYISGSTLKGVLRRSALRISHLLGYKVEYTVNPAKMDDDIVVRLFGGAGKQGKVYVYPSEPSVETTDILPHLRIDDVYGVNEKKGLFTREYIPIGKRIIFKLYGYGLEKNEARLLLASLAEMRFEKIGKAGLIDLKIDLSRSTIPEEFFRDDVIKEVLEEIGERS